MSDLKTQILCRVDSNPPGKVWGATDFTSLGSRAAVDKALQRLVADGQLRRIGRGLYDRPRFNPLTKKPASPDYRSIVDAIARHDDLRVLVDGMTAANDLGLTNAVPARVTIYTNARRRNIKLDKLNIDFKFVTAPSRLYWANRPAMRVVQALHWLKDTLPTDKPRILKRLSAILNDQEKGAAIRDDLEKGFHLLPAWMQEVLRDLGCCQGRVSNGRSPTRHVTTQPKPYESKLHHHHSGRRRGPT